jgi:hypothetical protein
LAQVAADGVGGILCGVRAGIEFDEFGRKAKRIKSGFHAFLRSHAA